MAARERFLLRGIDGVLAKELDSAHGVDSSGKPNTDLRLLSTRVEFQCAMSNVIDLDILEGVFLSGERFNHVIVLSDGIVEAEGAPEEVLRTSETLRRLFHSEAV